MGNLQDLVPSDVFIDDFPQHGLVKGNGFGPLEFIPQIGPGVLDSHDVDTRSAMWDPQLFGVQNLQPRAVMAVVEDLLHAVQKRSVPDMYKSPRHSQK